jgi:hypothetical protein
MPEKSRIRIAGNELVEKVRQLVSRGDVRRVCLLDEEGSFMEIPMDTGDPASPATMLKAPVLVALKALSTFINECTIEVEKANPPDKKES